MGRVGLDERWNTIDSAEMALGVRRVLNIVKRNQQPPSEYDAFLDKGIRFLNEAMAGGALISGMISEADSFNGTFSPLCLATDVYVVVKNDTPKDTNDYGSSGKVGKLLNGYENILEQIKARDSKTVIEEAELIEIEKFFKTLFDLLLRQTDPITKEYSHTFDF